MFYPRDWKSTTIEVFIQAVHGYILCYDEKTDQDIAELLQPQRVPRKSRLNQLKPDQDLRHTPLELLTFHCPASWGQFSEAGFLLEWGHRKSGA